MKLLENKEDKLEYRLKGFKDKTEEKLNEVTGAFPGSSAETIESVALGLSKEETIKA